jgi:hypothetical protein
MIYYKLGDSVLASEGSYELESANAVRYKVKYSNLNRPYEFKFNDDEFFLLSHAATLILKEITGEQFWSEMKESLKESGKKVYDSHVNAKGGGFLLPNDFDNARNSFIKKDGLDRMDFLYEHVYKNRPEIK